MEYRRLGASGLKVPVLSLRRRHVRRLGPAVRRLGQQRRQEARRLVDICLEAGVNLFDTADVYSNGARKRCWARRSRAAATRC